MYGQCNYNATIEKFQNCYQEPGTMNAIRIDPSEDGYVEAMSQLKLYCPYYFYDEDGKEIGKLSLFLIIFLHLCILGQPKIE